MHITLGLYRHYKGNLYQVIAVARHSENLEPFVVYQQLYGSYGMWIRPYSMFLETIEYQGNKVPRFEFVCEHLAHAPTVK